MRISIFNSKHYQCYSDSEVFMEILLVVSVVFFIVGIMWLCSLVHPALALTVGALLTAVLSSLAILYFKGRAIIDNQDDDRPEA